HRVWLSTARAADRGAARGRRPLAGRGLGRGRGHAHLLDQSPRRALAGRTAAARTGIHAPVGARRLAGRPPSAHGERMSLPACFVDASAATGAIPLLVLDRVAYPAWRETQPAATLAWLDANAFTPAAGSFALVP